MADLSSMPQPATPQLARLFTQFVQNHPLQTIQFGDIAWEYLAAGEGEEGVLVLNGGGFAAEAAFLYVAGLEGRTRVLVPTLPPAVASVDAAVRGIARLITEQNVRLLHVVGLSMGGTLAQALVRAHRDVAASLTLCATLAPSKEYANRRRSQVLLPLLPSAWVRIIGRLSFAQQIQAERVTSEEKKFWVGFFREQFASGRMTKASLLSAARLGADYCLHYQFGPDDLAGWDGKITIFEAEHDRVVGMVEQARLRATYPHAEVIALATRGHFGAVLLEADQVVAAVARGLRAGE